MYDTLLSAEDLLPHLEDPGWAIFDCRFKLDDTEAGRRAYLAAHIPGAQYAHLDDDLSGPKTGRNGRHPLPTPEAMIRTFSAWGITDGVQVVAYDDAGGGMGAARLWWLLRYMRHRPVAVLDGGWGAWAAAAYPTRPGAESRPPARFAGQPDAAMTRGADSLGGAVVIDARSLIRYLGEQEPYDPVAGHIPGAQHCDWMSTLGPDGRMLAPDALRAMLARLLAGAPPDQSVFYCGSGVSAAQNVLAMEVAGLAGARLYPGSWSEWCSDPARPVATGDERR